MLENMKKLLEEAITSLQEQENNILNNSSVHKYEKELKLLEDYHNILNVDLVVVKEVLNTLDYTDEEKTVIYKFISSIKTLLELNQTKNTTFTISKQQIKHLNLFIEKAKEKKAIIELENLKTKNEIQRKINLYNELLNKINNPKNKSFIT